MHASLPRSAVVREYPRDMAPRYPNRRNFEGVLTRIDLPSDKSPNGARGHRVILTREAVEEAIDSLKLAPIGFGNCWTIHNMRQRCGIITEAEIVGDELRVRGHLFAHDYPEVITVMEKGKLGMSYELDSCTVLDMQAAVWTITHFTFCGAAILYANSAAYGTTRISLAAAAALAESSDMPAEETGDFTFDFTLLNVREG